MCICVLLTLNSYMQACVWQSKADIRCLLFITLPYTLKQGLSNLEPVKMARFSQLSLGNLRSLPFEARITGGTPHSSSIYRSSKDLNSSPLSLHSKHPYPSDLWWAECLCQWYLRHCLSIKTWLWVPCKRPPIQRTSVHSSGAGYILVSFCGWEDQHCAQVPDLRSTLVRVVPSL